jgi:hypothetical protein
LFKGGKFEVNDGCITPPTTTEHHNVPLAADVDGFPKFGILKAIGFDMTKEPDTKEIVSTSLYTLANPAAPVEGEVKTKGVPGEQLANPLKVITILAFDGIVIRGTKETVSTLLDPIILSEVDNDIVVRYGFE